MAELKRYFVKYIRDASKARYPKGSECRICGTDEALEFHHYSTISVLANTWVRARKLSIDTAEDAVQYRDEFIAEHQYELYEDAVTLCKEHHAGLHRIYGKNPRLGTAAKQARWVEKQRINNGLVD